MMTAAFMQKLVSTPFARTLLTTGIFPFVFLGYLIAHPESRNIRVGGARVIVVCSGASYAFGPCDEIVAIAKLVSPANSVTTRLLNRSTLPYSWLSIGTCDFDVPIAYGHLIYRSPGRQEVVVVGLGGTSVYFGLMAAASY
jgi:hypothetical protein